MTDITVACRRPGFRRLGREHPALASYPAGALSADDIATLAADPMFTVRLADGTIIAPPPGGAGAPGTSQSRLPIEATVAAVLPAPFVAPVSPAIDAPDAGATTVSAGQASVTLPVDVAAEALLDHALANEAGKRARR